MIFDHRLTIPVARTELWDFMMDVPKLAACVPGVERIEPRGESGDDFGGLMRVRVGPIALALEGVLSVKERDTADHRATVDAEATDRKVGGGLRANATMSLVEVDPAHTELVIHADARLLGKLSEFGQPVIRKKAEQMVAEFARNVAAQFAQ